MESHTKGQSFSSLLDLNIALDICQESALPLDNCLFQAVNDPMSSLYPRIVTWSTLSKFL